MCEHCRSFGGNRRKIENQEPVRVLCESAGRGNGSNRKTNASGCCEWRQTCCGGGCCEDTNCCGAGSSGLNVGYNNTRFDYRNKIVPIGMETGINHVAKYCGGMRSNEEMNKVLGPEMIDAETVLCGSQKYKYCSGGECYLNGGETRKGENEDKRTGETSDTEIMKI